RVGTHAIIMPAYGGQTLVRSAHLSAVCWRSAQYMSRANRVSLAALVLARATVATAQQAQPAPVDGRAQYPLLLRDSYVSINLGWIGYAFSASQLQRGVQ